MTIKSKQTVPRATAFKMFRASLTPLKCHHPRGRLKRRNELKRTAMRIGAVHIKRCRNGRLKSNLRSQARTRELKTNSAWKNAMNQGRFSNRSLGTFAKNFFMGCVAALSPCGPAVAGCVFLQDESCLQDNDQTEGFRISKTYNSLLGLRIQLRPVTYRRRANLRVYTVLTCEFILSLGRRVCLTR